MHQNLHGRLRQDIMQSVLLEAEVQYSEDIVHRYGKGEYLSTGRIEIVNQRNGSIYICVDTFAHVNVDRIRHTVFLDQWDERKQDWVQVDSWEFERTKEEVGGELPSMTDTITIKNVATNRYYRARGLHMVEIGDEIEGCATETEWRSHHQRLTLTNPVYNLGLII